MAKILIVDDSVVARMSIKGCIPIPLEGWSIMKAQIMPVSNVHERY